ncbi:MAG: Ig-like domain-containing protein [Agathobacter sp.]|nr:Ig-like domain-containing protein [Agathobacter sp.]
MKKRTMKGMMMRRAFCSAMAFAMVFSSLVLPQGAITVYAEEELSSPSALEAKIVPVSSNKVTQIKNGNFEDIPWIDYVYNGVTYTQQTRDTSLGSDKTITSSIRKGVDEGWNTTEINPYQGNLFEVWPTEQGKMPAESERTNRDLTKNGRYFIEMNTSNPAALYQDLSTQGGDVIKWTLQHADRAGHGFQEQRMYVTIGAPEIENGQIVAATGVKDEINTHIVDDGKAEYKYDSDSQTGVVSGSSARANPDELKGLSVNRGERKWCTAAGIYVVPQGQDVTRFAFCADGLSKKNGESDSLLSGGNFLDNITFSTLIGSLKATKQSDNSVKVTGYWGDSDEKKKLIVGFGSSDKEAVDMSKVCGKYFEITIPAETIGKAENVSVYHEDYETATKSVPITHEYEWKYKDGNTVSSDANKIYAYCAMVEGDSGNNTHVCDYNNVSDKKVSLTLNAPDAVYTGEAYKEAWVSNWSITDIGLAAKPEITYYCLNDNHVETKTDASNSGAASAGASPKNAGTYRAKITITDGTNPGTTVTAMKDFVISPLTIDTVAFKEPTTTPGSSQATSLKTANNAYYTGTISWEPSEGTFGYNKFYTATVTLTLKDSGNCKFADSVQCANSGWTVQSPSVEGTRVLTKNYTTAKAKITSVNAPEVTTQLTEFTTEDKQIEVLPTTVAVVVQDKAKTSMAITWQLKTDTTYSGEPEAENTFVWKVNPDEYSGYDSNGQTLTGEVTIKNPVHTHNWTYGAQGNQLTASCSKGGTQGCPYDSAHKLTLTLNASNATFSGSAYTGASIATEGQSAWTAAGLAMPTIQYEGDTGTTYPISSDAPTAAGNYKAVISAEGQRAEAAFLITSGGSGSGGDDSGSGGQSGGGSGSGSASGSGGSGSGSSSGGGSGGGSTPSTPSEPTNPTENFSIPVKNEQTVKVEAEIKEGTANVSEITNETIDKVVNNKDSESKVDTITIDLSGAKQEVTGVTLSKESVQTLAQTTAAADNGIDTATIQLSKATVILDNKTLETLVEQAKGNDIRLVVEDKDRKELNTVQQTSLSQHQVATTFEAYFVSDGQRIHDFKGGKAVVSIDFTPEAGKDTSYYHLVYVAENGEMTRYKTKYETGKLMFTATHFSDYAVIYDTGEKNETLKPEEEKADSTDTDARVAMDTSYSKLRLRIPTSTRTTNVLKWTKQTGADGYVIYGNLCNSKGKTYKLVKQVTIKDNTTTSWIDTKLARGTYYKYYIKAYKLVDGKKVWIAKSKVVHSTTTGGKYGNAKSVKVNKTSVSLTVGKTFSIKAEQVLKDKPIAGHQNIKYESGNSKVASVTSKGVIKAKKKGTCYIYVYAQNGMYKRIKVTVQ